MLEETAKAAGQAAETISQTVWGALLILSWIIFGIVVWFMRKDLIKEKSDHQTTREEYVSVLKGKDQIAAGLLTIQDGQRAISEGQERLTSLLIDTLTGRRTG